MTTQIDPVPLRAGPPGRCGLGCERGGTPRDDEKGAGAMVKWRRRILLAVLGPLTALVLGACGDGAADKDAAGASKGGKATAIKVVIAEYSKDHTRPFWQALSDTFTKQTGVKAELQVIDWNSIDQQVSTMIQNSQPPDILNLNAFSSYAKDGLL